MSSPIASTSRQMLSGVVGRSARRYATSSVPGSAAAAAQTPAAAEDHVTTSLLLSRPPRILRTPHPFETAYFSYNARLQRALAQPFPKDFYFKRGSAAERRFDQEEAARRAAKTEEAAAAAAASSEGEAGQAKGLSEEGVQENSPAPRQTKADELGDVKSLDRALDRTLFLLVKEQGPQGRGWTLPSTTVPKSGRSEGSETLHLRAPGAVTKLLGDSMDIWMINHLPVGVLPLLEAGSDKVSTTWPLVFRDPQTDAKRHLADLCDAGSHPRGTSL